MLRALRDEGISLPLTPEALEAAYPVRDYTSFFAWFAAHGQLKDHFWLYEHVARMHVERLKRQNVVYAELFVAALSLDPERAEAQLAGLRTAIDGCEQGLIQVELVNAWRRNRDLESIERIATRNIRLFERGLLCGVAVAGPAQGAAIAPLARVIDRYHEAGVPIEIHAAEWAGPESAWDALEHGHPRRLGHGTHIFRDTRLVETVRERRLHIEMCPTSNLLTGSIARIEDHPIRRAFDAGLDISVNTDDPGAFMCSMASEHALLAERFGFTPEERRRLGASAVRARFQPTLRTAAARALAD
jgi:adenosine deaminase